MSDDEIDAIIEALRPHIRNAVRDALGRAYTAGEESMRQTILKAASRPGVTILKSERKPEPSDRAPRGLVQEVVACVLRDRPGTHINEVEVEAVRREPRISAKSVGNEMRRYLGTKYRREGRSWFLMEAADAPTKETSAA